MYPEDEIDISKSNLSTVVASVKEPVCLLGGWAVFIIVNKNFRAANGRDYIGSRDIDLGFHIDEAWSDTELQKSAFGQSIKILTDLKYYGIGSRFVQHHDLDTRKLLTEDEARKRPRYTMFDLFVDPIVDKIHPRTKELFGFVPIDEPMLTKVFIDRKFTMSREFGREIMLPYPEVLVATKIGSAPNRDKDEKRIKDIADIYSLMWYSDTDFSELRQRIREICDIKNIASAVSKFTDNDYAAVSNAIGIGKDEVARVLSEMAGK